MNFLPYGLSLLAGLTWATSPGTAARRSLPVGIMICVAGFALVRPLFGTTPPCHNQWKGDVCLQSSLSTCSAACAATLLKAHGIDVQESEMAAACLTRKGTSWQGLFRGLCQKTQGTPWVVEVSSPSWDALEATEEHPVIIDVGILSMEDVPKIYTEEYGWQVGQLHSVVDYGERPNNRVAIAEPTPGVGREEWTKDDLKILYRGRCYRLIPR